MNINKLFPLMCLHNSLDNERSAHLVFIKINY